MNTPASGNGASSFGQVPGSDGEGLAVYAEAEGNAETGAEVTVDKKKRREEKVTWRSLPHRRQLIILTLARLSEPLVQTSLQAYMFYQLKSFDESLPDSTIAAQAGLMSSSFTGAQFLTAMVWGRLSDSERGGRKLVLLIGLFGTCVSCVGFGFARSFSQAIFFRTLGGMLNGNIGVMRTMVSEIVQDKKYQPRAFLLFPMCFNIGVIIGPILGGLLADPARNYPKLFGQIQWLQRFPYAAPNLLSAFFLFCAASGVFFGLAETLESIRHKEDLGIKCARKIGEAFTGFSSHRYSAIPMHSRDVSVASAVEHQPLSRTRPPPRWKNTLPFKRIFTYNVICTLVAHTLLAIHSGTFNSLWFVFLSTPVAANAQPHNPFIFSGGLGLQPRDVGFAMALLGSIGISMQLFIYPVVNNKIGTVRSWRIFLYAFPVAYSLIPFLATVKSKSPPPHHKDGPWLWITLCGVLSIQVTARTFVLPAMTILVNNASPHPSVLGTMHGLGQSLSSAGRTIGPIMGGYLYGFWLQKGVVGAVWWGLSVIASVGCVASYWVREGDGHEITLDGDDEAAAQFQADLAERQRTAR